MARCGFAAWRPSPNDYPDGLAAQPSGVVLHIEEGTEASTAVWFHTPSSQVSAHFGVSKAGTVDQFVDTESAAWAEMAGNAAWLSIEHEGFAGEALTPAQLAATARVVAWCKGHEGGPGYSFPLQVTDSVDRPGIGWHGMGGAQWGGHTGCPGDPIKAQRPAIIAEVLSLLGGHPPAPAPAPHPAPGPAPAPSAGPAWPGRYLRYPPITMGADVREWQARMAARGWSIAADGAYGPASSSCARAFQQQKHLAVDGIVGPVTWRAAWALPVTPD